MFYSTNLVYPLKFKPLFHFSAVMYSRFILHALFNSPFFYNLLSFFWVWLYCLILYTSGWQVHGAFSKEDIFVLCPLCFISSEQGFSRSCDTRQCWMIDMVPVHRGSLWSKWFAVPHNTRAAESPAQRFNARNNNRPKIVCVCVWNRSLLGCAKQHIFYIN